MFSEKSKQLLKTGIKIVLILLVIIFWLVWALLVLFFGGTPSPGKVLGESFLQAFFSILTQGFIISIIIVFPLAGLIIYLSLSAKPSFKKIAWIFLFIFALGLTILFSYGDIITLLSIKSIPAPPEADESYYFYQHCGGDVMGISCVKLVFTFNWEKNLSLEEKMSKIQGTIQFYQDFAQRKGWPIYGYYYPPDDNYYYPLQLPKIPERLDSCMESFNKRKLQVQVKCVFETRSFGKEIPLELYISENGGLIYKAYGLP